MAKEGGDLFHEVCQTGRSDYPPEIRFVTYTLKYATCNWVEILGLERHYERSLVEAKRSDNGFTLKTANIRALHLTLAGWAGAGADRHHRQPKTERAALA